MTNEYFRRRIAALALGALVFQFPAFADLPPDFILGAGLSSVKHQETWKSFKDVDGEYKPVLRIFRAHGYGWIRLDLFHTPANGPYKLPNDLAYTSAFASEAKRLGYKFLLDYHLSDTWANPGAQSLPMAWKDLSLAPQGQKLGGSKRAGRSVRVDKKGQGHGYGMDGKAPQLDFRT